MSSKKTSLYEEHVSLNAKIVDFAGWDMPVQYSSVKDEVLAVRNSVGVFDVSHMGEFWIKGNDAAKFIDYLLPNDIINAPNGKAIYSPLCRENGTTIDDLIVYKFSDKEIFICVNASNIEKDFNWIKSKHVGFDCTLENQSEKYSLLAVQGPQTFNVLSKIIKNLDDIEYYSVSKNTYSGSDIIMARTGYTGEDGFEIFGNHLTIKKLWSELLNNKVIPCGLASRDVLRLEVCYPLYGHELNDDTIPQEATLGWTLKLNKETFIGKDALINTKPKYKLIKLILDKGIPRDGYNVENDQAEVIGKVTSGTLSVVLNKGVCLARIEVSKIPSNEIYMINIRDKKYEAKLTKTAFVKGGHK
jgi:aminomethyltransferase